MRSTVEPRLGTKTSPTLAASAGLAGEQLLTIYATMVRSRLVDERMWVLNRQGRGAFTISCQGHEAAQVGSARALVAGQDVVFPYYRDVGVVLSLGMTPCDLMLAFFARAADPSSGGRQMPNHFGSVEHRIISVSSPVATQIPQAAGAALAAKMRHETAVVAVYFGEGCTSSGHFHEGLNFASIHRLPVIFICENNHCAISVPSEKQMVVSTVAERAAAYGMPGVVVDGIDPLAVFDATSTAVERARGGGGPTLIDAQVCRLRPHSSDDDDRRYRSADDLESARQHDPLEHFRRTLFERGVLDRALDEEIHQREAATVDAAVAFAEASPEPDLATMRLHVYRMEG
ncbi:MAG TPA: thiamine pyrophosphate-dependent dehydrogenase E1 component subunit alpha [Chloroflexota bacterium]|nr:thiamine pyrophosphate-dependent dehydrogenase E1 component subunit alpha [Chloroflexota bacterium]